MSEDVFKPGDASLDTKVQPEAGKDASQDGSLEAEAAAMDAADEQTGDVIVDVPGDGECAAGQKLCSGACVDAKSPANGCGGASCDPCAFANATATCKSEACAIGTCNVGFADCNDDEADGCEADTKGDPANCGSCGYKCVVPQATPNCINGTCGVETCNSGYANCDNDHVNGCEASLQTDPDNCGKCGNQCAPVGQSACLAGECKVTACQGQMGDCDMQPGCETDLSISLQHCGACGNACALPNATPVCQDKACRVASCNLGYANCDADHANGCEINVTNTASHCGGCAAACSDLNNSSRACGSGLCSYTCSPGFADCNGPQPGASDDGCETPVAADVLNCGGCGLKCSTNNGTPSCLAGICSISCSPGYRNCNANAADGCEINSTNDVNNCGNCEVGCSNPHGGTACVNSLCSPTCDPGWKSCDNLAANGCEQSVTSDPNNCGDCGIKCAALNGSNTCVGTACKPVCTAGFDTCDGDANNGCETNLNTDELNCGVCGKKCLPGPNMQADCNLGACSYSCSDGFWDIDKNPVNGCEYKCTKTADSTEVCDNKDNDCDGTIDNGFDKQNDPNNCGNTCQKCGDMTNIGLCCAGTCVAASVTNCGACGLACTQGMLVISEVMANPANPPDDAEGEWFELFNKSSSAIDLRGFKIYDLNPTPDSHTIASATPVMVPANGYAVLGRNGNTLTNGGVPVIYQYGSNWDIGQSNDEIILQAHGNVEIDRVAYTSGFAPSGYSMELSKNRLDYLLNNNTTTGSSSNYWCQATQLYFPLNYGTPGVVNTCAK